MCFFEGEDLKVQLSWSLEGVNIGMNFCCRWKSRRCEVLIVFCVERPSKEDAPFGRGIKLCGSSSCLGGLRSLLNTEGILTLPMFLLSDGSLIWIWSSSFAQWCRVLLSLSIILKSFKFCFWVFLWRCDGFWWHWWFDIYGLKLLLSGTCWFHLCIQLCSCWLGISSGRLYQFSVHVELDPLDAWVKSWWWWYLQRKLFNSVFC